MGAIETKTFRSGNSVALRLPKALGIGPDQTLLIDQNGSVLTIRPVHDIEEERRKVRALFDALAAIGTPSDGVQKRPDFIAPIRRGL